jgi:AraC-like DNA-binding protein
MTIGALASRLVVPEERLRALNEGLGYRNFNAFINHYRLEDARTALSDPSQHDVHVLTIAMDAGFQSLGPFNRAFKADTGMTRRSTGGWRAARLRLTRRGPAKVIEKSASRFPEFGEPERELR